MSDYPSEPVRHIAGWVTVTQQLIDEELGPRRPRPQVPLRLRLRVRLKGYAYRVRGAIALRIAPWLREDDWEDW